MSFPEPTRPHDTRSDVLLGYLDYFRARILAKLRELPPTELRRSRLASSWTPLELLKHLIHVELRWLEWRFAGRAVDDPWGDERAGRWFVADTEDLDGLARELEDRAFISRSIVLAADLGDIGRPGPQWDGAEPASLERVLLHLVQEYARHLGQCDVVVELVAGSASGE